MSDAYNVPTARGCNHSYQSPPLQIGMRSPHNEPIVNQEVEGLTSGGGGGKDMQRQDLHTPPHMAESNGGPLETAPLQRVPPSSAGPSASAVARPREKASCGDDLLPMLSRKRPLPSDPTVVVLDELSVDLVTNAVLGVPHPGLGVQHLGRDHRRVAVVVWNVGHCGDEDEFGILPKLVDRLVRTSAVDEHTRVLVVDDASSASLARHLRRNTGGASMRGHDEVVNDTVEAAMHAMKVGRSCCLAISSIWACPRFRYSDTCRGGAPIFSDPRHLWNLIIL